MLKKKVKVLDESKGVVDDKHHLLEEQENDDTSSDLERQVERELKAAELLCKKLNERSKRREVENMRLGFVGSIDIRKKDFETLDARNWLNDNVISAYFSTLQVSELSLAFMTTFLVLSNGNLRSECVKHFVDAVNKNNFVVVPINIGDCHWTLVVIDCLQRRMFYMDPMTQQQTEKGRKVLSNLSNAFESNSSSDIKFSLHFSTHHAIQNDNHSCGVFVCYFGKIVVDEVKKNKEIFSDTWFSKRPNIISFRNLIRDQIFSNLATHQTYVG